jgi:hypothetical protein
MAINFLDGIAVDGDVTIGPVASSAGLLHVSAGTSGDARVVIHADTDNNDENDVPQIWFKADGDITEGLIGLNNNYLDFVSNVSGLNGFRYFTGTTNNAGTTDPYTNATEKMRLTNAGDLGIGTTDPAKKLHVSNGDIRIDDSKQLQFGSGGVKINNDASGRMYQKAPLDFYWETQGYQMVLKQAGNLGIGTTSPISQLHIKKTTSLGPIIQLENAYNGSGADTLIRFGDSTENYSYSVGSDDSANSFRISYNGTSYNGAVPGTNDFLVFDTGGNAEIPNGDLSVSLGSIAVGNISNSATNGRIDASNDIVAYSTSDIRLKDNIKSIDKALDKVNSIQGVEFDWIEKEEVHGNSGHDVGVIAQEIEKVLPDVVTTRDSGYKAVKYEKIVPLLIEAIKELTNEVNELKRLI